MIRAASPISAKETAESQRAVLNFNKKINFKSILPARYTSEIDTAEPIADIDSSVRDYIWQKYQWKVVVLSAVLIAAGIYLAVSTREWRFFAFPLLILLGIYRHIEEKMRRAFWRQFAQTRGWSYQEKGDTSLERALSFNRGHSRRMANVISGQTEVGPIRIFEYHYATGSGKHRRDYDYVVFEFVFTGNFPHMYLDALNNGYNHSAGEKLSLPAEFEKQYKLYAPRKYEIEALEIFTPDVLNHLLDSKLKSDVELVENEMLFFSEGNVSSLKSLTEEFDQVLDFAKRLKKKLDKFNFTIIGDMPHLLSK